MKKQELVNRLLEQIERSDAENTNQIFITKEDAVQIVRFLEENKDYVRVSRGENGQTLFYCADCGRSFWANGREDPECFEKWKYHTWYANCPRCEREVAQTDRYWR